MKQKILLLGRGKTVIDDFFMHFDDDFEIQCSSMHSKDITSHLRYYEPDVIVYCMYKESKEDMSMLSSFSSQLERLEIPLIIIGNFEECEEFDIISHCMSSKTLLKPLSIRNIQSELQKFFESRQAEEKAAMEKAAEEKAAMEKAAEEKAAMEKAAREKAAIEKAALEKDKAKDVPVRKHILVVDDDPMMLKLIKEQLKDYYTVATAINGNIALKFLENRTTDLIILDYEMPQQNGAEVLKKIRDNKATASIPVIFLTGINDGSKIKKVLDLNPQGYLLKPIDSQMLISVLEKTLK